MRLFHFIRSNLFTSSLFLFLFTLSYLLGLFQNSNLTNFPSRPNQTTPLDFSPCHVSNANASLSSYPPCDPRFSEYTPCQDVKRSRKFPRTRLTRMERHCPEAREILKCRIPAPVGYRNPFEWPASRDYAWYANVPHKHLTVSKAVQNWIRFEGDRFRFPGGGTTFPNGADKYIEEIGELVDLRNGYIRTAVDTGCGVASWGAYLLSRDILTMSFAPKDTHEAQVQFALERGVPAMLGILSTMRLPYPARAFDMAHCSRCLIPWTNYDGIYLIEIDRVLRPGGFWILSGPPINWKHRWKGWERTENDLNAEQTKLENLIRSLCWKKLVEKDDIAIWQKQLNHLECKVDKKFGLNLPFCPKDQDADKAWYTKMETCVTHLPDVSGNEEVAGGLVARWPVRLNAVPPRISKGAVEGVTPETFLEDKELWNKRVLHYMKVNSLLGQAGRYRNILDMNAYLGSFAAALIDLPVWVMNVVPVQARVNTLGVIYERGLIGTYQDWCEAMSTYPRTYDLIHADSVFTLYQDRCEMEHILLEMDRVLRPEGTVIFRDDVDMLVKIKKIIGALDWEGQIIDHEDGPHQREKLLFAVKTYWTSPAVPGQNATATS